VTLPWNRHKQLEQALFQIAMEAQQQAVSDQMPGLTQEDATETIERETIKLRRGNSLLCSQLNELLGDGMLACAQSFRDKRERDPREALMDYKGQFADLVQRCSTALSSSSSMMAYLLRRAQRAEAQLREVQSSGTHRRQDSDTPTARAASSAENGAGDAEDGGELPARTWLVHTTGYLQTRVKALEKELTEARADRRDLMREIHRRKAMGLWDAKEEVANAHDTHLFHASSPVHANTSQNSLQQSNQVALHRQARGGQTPEQGLSWDSLVHTRYRSEMDNLWDKVQQESVAAQKMVDELKRRQDQEVEAREHVLLERKARILEAEKAFMQRRALKSDMTDDVFRYDHDERDGLVSVMRASIDHTWRANTHDHKSAESAQAVEARRSDQEALWVALDRSREAIESLKRAREEDAGMMATLLQENGFLRKELAGLRDTVMLHSGSNTLEAGVSEQEVTMLEARCAVLSAEVAALERLCAMRGDEAHATAQV
jgi:hypothetical protein